MKTQITALALFTGIFAFGQIGINTPSPQATLDVRGKATDPTVPDGIIAPRLTGLQLRAKTYTPIQNGAMVYVITADPSPQGQTINVTDPGYYYFDGSSSRWISFKSSNNPVTDATRYLGGTVFANFAVVNGGTIPNSRVIGGAVNTVYSVGNLGNQRSSKGSITQLYGLGYTISNPGQGIYDIQFDTPLQKIYGISLNILDGYGQGTQGQLSGGAVTKPSEPGNILLTTDNTQVSYVSNTIIRVKTGDGNGNLSNRPFSFLISGQ
jgi:hypothetical protein